MPLTWRTQKPASGHVAPNPCIGAERNPERPREREARPWEIEAILSCATPPLDLWIRWTLATGWRQGDILDLQRGQLEADGIRLRQSKRGSRQIWAWSPELRAVIAEALERPGARDSIYVFAAPPRVPGTPPRRYTQSALQSAWRRAVARANAMLASVVDPSGSSAPNAPQIRGLTFHDLRAEAICEAEESRGDGARLAGHADPRTTKRHYLRRPAKVTPLR